MTSAVAKLVEKWHTISRLYGAPDAIRDAVYQQCADDMEAALAIAPPEQAARRYAEAWIVLQNGRVHSVHATREHANLEKGENLRMPEAPWAILGSELQPQAASDWALDAADVEKFAAELHEVYWQESIRQRDITGLVPRHRRDYNELSEDIKDYDRALARYVLAALASHDQKVRAEALEEIIKAYDDPDMTELIFSKYLHGLAAPAASKPEAAAKP